MNKKLLITILTIFGLTVVVGGFWYVQRYIQDDSQKVVNNEQENIEVIENEDQNNKQENQSNNQENQTVTKQLLPEEIEKLKQEKDLVWYEIPELGIKFLVTRDIKKDLGHHFSVNEKYKGSSSVVLYSNGGINYGKYEDECRLHEEGWTCGRILLTSATKKYAEQYKRKYGRDFCANSNKDNEPEGIWIFDNKNEMICFNYTYPYIKTVISDSFYKKKFYKKNSNKNFGIYLNTIQSIK